MTLKKNERAPYEGVLMPKLNYRNYKALEEVAPKLDEAIHSDLAEPVSDSWQAPILWGTIGLTLGIFLGATVIK